MAVEGETGEVTRDRVDILDQIRQRGTNGITAAVAARLMTSDDKPGRNAVERARRWLDRKVADGLLVQMKGRKGGADKEETTWFLAAQGNHESNHARDWG